MFFQILAASGKADEAKKAAPSPAPVPQLHLVPGAKPLTKQVRSGTKSLAALPLFQKLGFLVQGLERLGICDECAMTNSVKCEDCPSLSWRCMKGVFRGLVVHQNIGRMLNGDVVL